MTSRVVIVPLLVLTCAATPYGSAAEPQVPLPADLSGTLDGVVYRIRVPANWNETLLVFAHGTQVGPPIAEVAPAAWPVEVPSLEEQLLGLGYAVAGSGFPNSDKEGVQHTIALTEFFRDTIGNPHRIVIWGNSLGGKIALKLIEKYPGVFDGAVANCAPSAGTPENYDSGLSFSLAYAAAFGWPDDAWGPVGDLRDGLSFWEDVLPIVLPQSPDVNPATYGRWEFIRLVLRLPPQAFWLADPLTGSPFFGLQMWKATERRAAGEAENGGPVAENVGLQYTLTDTDKQYLAALGVDADELLAYMNTRTTITADIAARNHAEQWGGFTGNLRRPVLTMHAKSDGLAFVSNEAYYADLVLAAGSSDHLVQAYVTAVGHCSFSAAQYLSAIAAMNSWLDTGVRPGVSLLPPELAFDLGFVPPPWQH